MTNPSKFMKDFKEFINTPTDEELNKRSHEILSMCWHSGHWVQGQGLSCEKCGFTTFSHHFNIDFTTSWAGFGILIEWWRKHPLYPQFHRFLWEEYKHNHSNLEIIVGIPEKYLAPLALTQATVEFFKED